ncbi:hypothetical protein VTK56DRAFT_3156 [Thermocarpiscus australiensis]
MKETPIPTNRLVHWDIDPQNILLGDYYVGPRPERHGVVPVLKLGDFGSACAINPELLQQRSLMWQLRANAKYRFFTPEQFSEEWDWIDGCPNDAGHIRHGTAGQYGWKTNLYQLGLLTFTPGDGLCHHALLPRRAAVPGTD